MSGDEKLLQLLKQFGDAFNRHDAGALMSMMTADAVFELSVGPDVNGERHEDA